MRDVPQGDDLALVDLGDVLEADHETDLGYPPTPPEFWTPTPHGEQSGATCGDAVCRRTRARRRGSASALVAGAPPLEERLDEAVEVAVEHRLHVAGLVPGALVLHELVRLQACTCGSDCRSRCRASPPTAARARRAAPRAAARASRAARICIAFVLFCSCERWFWHDTTMPVGRWVMRTAESVTLTCWPPAPDERYVSMRRSLGVDVGRLGLRRARAPRRTPRTRSGGARWRRTARCGSAGARPSRR